MRKRVVAFAERRQVGGVIVAAVLEPPEMMHLEATAAAALSRRERLRCLAEERECRDAAGVSIALEDGLLQRTIELWMHVDALHRPRGARVRFLVLVRARALPRHRRMMLRGPERLLDEF